MKGERRREKPIVKKKFVRIKETLYSYNNGKIKVSIKPYEEYIMFDISKAWFFEKSKRRNGRTNIERALLNNNF